MSKSRRLIFVGLDGLSYHDILQYDLRYLAYLWDASNSGVLKIPELAYTPPSWTTIFTGKSYKEHGIVDFFQAKKLSLESGLGRYADAKLNTREDIKSKLIWEDLQEQGYKAMIVNACCTLPPLTNVDYMEEYVGIPEWPSFSRTWYLPNKAEEFRPYYESLSAAVTKSLDMEWDFLLVTDVVPDKIQHLMNAGKLNHRSAVPFYYMCDNFVYQVLKKHKDAFIIASDHGRAFKNLKWSVVKEYNNRVEMHSPFGIVITNLPKLPETNFDIYPLIKNYFGINGR